MAQLGAEICGVSLDELPVPNHWNLIDLAFPSHHVDLRDRSRLEDVVQQFNPEVVFHLAAQPLVRRSYRDPYETWSTNVMGTANLLEACRKCDELAAMVIVTTDKCYRNQECPQGYSEDDALGGYDPYSASKAATELLVGSYRQSVYAERPSTLIATARAGNVIGGGDWAEDRLIPDAARAVENGQSLEVRYPLAVRPWQHVLDSLSGYLLLGQKLLEGNSTLADAWNFGPEKDQPQTVADVLNRLQVHWPSLRWHQTSVTHPHESRMLQLSTVKARTNLDWRPVWSFQESIDFTASWYHAFCENRSVISHEQLATYIQDASERDHVWTRPTAVPEFARTSPIP